MAAYEAADDDFTGPTRPRMLLGIALRRLREEAGVGREEAGHHIRASASKMSRLELGRVSFKQRDVQDLLRLYELGETEESAALLELMEQSNQPGWWKKFQEHMPHKRFEDFLGLEEAASRIQTYELQVVPGLLQTEDYARAIITYGLPPDKENEREERLVRLRMRRQKLLYRQNAPRLWAVVDESVLHRPIGGTDVYRAQLDHLLEMTKMPHVSFQVVPLARSGYAAESAFTLLRFAEPELPDIGYIDHIADGEFLERDQDIERIGRALDRLVVDAETPEQSRRMIARARAQISNTS